MNTEKSHSKYLGEGSYGCVVKPPVKCKNKVKLRKEKKKEILVGKIFANNNNFKKEIIANKNIIAIDKTGNKLLSATSYCTVPIKNFKDTNRTKMCEFKHGYKKQPFLYQLNMPYGGITFKEYFKMNTYSIYDILKSLVNPFETLVLLEKKKMCHQDIKPDNILVKPSKESIIIDYGLMISYNKVYSLENRHRLKYSYFPYPPEYKIFEFIHFQKCYKYQYCNYIYNNYISNRSPTVSSNILEKLFDNNEIINIFKRKIDNLIEKDKDGIIEKYMIKYANRIDVFSLGMTLVRMLKYVNYNLTDNNINTFIRNLIHPDFKVRYTPKEALNHLKIIINK